MPFHSPRILAHRGASGHALENSLAAFDAARKLGADGVELDVHATADGMLLVHHDPELPGRGAIGALTGSEIETLVLSNGEPIPTLPKALEVLGGLEVWIEVKALPVSADLGLLAAIDGSPTPDRCAVHSFDHRIIARLGSLRPTLRRGILSASYPLDPVGPMVTAGATALWQESHLIDAELVEAIHRRGGEVIAWTVNDPAMARQLGALGVDALCGNYPERLRSS
jgi:glycerophosphoryl diester phosphodiesterase